MDNTEIGDSSPPAQPIVINVGLYRMGTRSLAEAYRILGYHTHHGLDNILSNPWRELEAAAEAKWPFIPGAQARAPYTRKDWDTLIGPYEVITDLFSPFAEELIKTYPTAKVVIVQRDFRSWWSSIELNLISIVFSPYAQFLSFIAWQLLGLRATFAMRKVLCGFFNAKNQTEIEQNAAFAYDEFYSRIRALVPAERRLEYQLNSGWEPLCSFLGKPIPDVAFPKINDKAALQADLRKCYKRIALDSWRVCLPSLLVLLLCMLVAQEILPLKWIVLESLEVLKG